MKFLSSKRPLKINIYMGNKIVIVRKKTSPYLLNFASMLLFVTLLLVFFSDFHDFFKLLSIVFLSDYSRK